MDLNPQQLIAANALQGCHVTIAGPGSGKTTVFVQRFRNLLEAKVPFGSILNLTFTNSAAKLMCERVNLTDPEKVFKTFHAFALDLIKKERDHLPFVLCDSVLPSDLQDYQLLFDLRDSYRVINWRELQERISCWKSKGVPPDQAIEEEGESNGIGYIYALAYRDYETRCRQQGWLDFDSLIDETLKLLQTNENVRARWQRDYIAVDECQDTDVRQFKILQLIFKKNIFVVGDEKQLIYEWRYAQSGNLTNFARLFPEAKKLFLGQNYRSSGNIVQFLREIAPLNDGLEMFTDNPPGEPVYFTKYRDEDEEARHILDSIIDPEHTAIIARTNRQLYVYHRLCTMKSIKYKILGKKDYWDSNEIKKLLSHARQSNSRKPASEVLADLIREHNMVAKYKDSATRDSNPVDNLNSIVQMAANKGTIGEFLAYLRKKTYARKAEQGLTLSTVHQSKGTEYKNVYLIGASEGKLPHKDGEINEERRILFVACSRAADVLKISYIGNISGLLLDYEDRVVKYGEPTEELE